MAIQVGSFIKQIAQHGHQIGVIVCAQARMGRARDLFNKFEKEGTAAIEEFISEQRSEELFLDFKRSADNGEGAKLHQDDRTNLARSVSGFGNSEGGVVVWGVECSKQPALGDVPTLKWPITSPRRFVSWLEGATSGCTLPPEPGVGHLAILEAGGSSGFVVTFIPKSQFAPIQCLYGKSQYLIRVGSNFEPTPRGVLAGMFGVRPAPELIHAWENRSGALQRNKPGDTVVRASSAPMDKPYARAAFSLTNIGRGLARDLFVNFTFKRPSRDTHFTNEQLPAGWTVHESTNAWYLTTDDGYKLAPGASVSPLSLSVYFVSPFDADFSYEITFGCSGSSMRTVTAKTGSHYVGAAVSQFSGTDGTSEPGQIFAETVFKLSQPLSYEID